MSPDRRILAVIPARAGSKGVLRKNARLLRGRPLIEYTILAALEVRHLFHGIVVSTDDTEIAEISRRCGAEVPFMRPAALASDTARSVDVLRHATEFIESRDRIRFDWLCLLQPTTPLRTAADIEEAISLIGDGEFDSIISVKRVSEEHPIAMKRIVNDQLVPFCVEELEGTRRQDYDPPAYLRNGAIYMTRRAVVVDKRSIWGTRIRPFVMPAERSVSVDTELDFMLAEQLLANAANQ